MNKTKKHLKNIALALLTVLLISTQTYCNNPGLTEEEKQGFKANAVTLSLYDAQNYVYGFTWNTLSQPVKPTVKIYRGTNTNKLYKSTAATFEQKRNRLSYQIDDFEFFVCKAHVQLTAGETYTYVICDDYAGVKTAPATVTVTPQSENFTFVHVSDSQTYYDFGVTKDTGKYFNNVLNNIDKKTAFLVHSGDVVEYGKFEDYWSAMLNENYSILKSTPVMAISGNHETTYATHESAYAYYATINHFNYNLPEQSDLSLGFYYSFCYGNAKLIMLNTNLLTSSNKLTDEQFDWLKNELSTDKRKWTIVCMHNPIYSVGKWGSDLSRNHVARALKDQLAATFAEYGVDLVLQGHDHMISRTHPINQKLTPTSENIVSENGVDYSVNPDGTIYVMNGASGNQSKGEYDVKISDEDKVLYDYYGGSNPSSWAEIKINGDYLTVFVKSSDDVTTTTERVWGIKKNNRF